VKRLSLILGTTGTVTLPLFEGKYRRISAVCVMATPAAGTECLVLTVLRGGATVARFQTAGAAFSSGSAAFTLAVGADNNDAFLAAIPAIPLTYADSPRGALPPDLVTTPNDTVTIGFDSPPTTVDSDLIVSYEEP